MRILDEKREGLYVIRTLDVLMSSGVGLEAALHTIGQGGYGIISEDFSKIMKRLSGGKSRGLEYELKSMMSTAESDGYRRLLNTLYNNVTQNTDVVDTLRKQGSRMEEERAEEVKKYIEELGGVQGCSDRDLTHLEGGGDISGEGNYRAIITIKSKYA